MTNCDCCRFNSEVSEASDPACGRTFPSGATAQAPFSKSGNLVTTGISTIKITGGSGGYSHRRLPHLTINTNDGFSVNASFCIAGGLDPTHITYVARPTAGKQGVFAFGWLVEMNWSDETLRAYSCDEEGTPTSAAWYEQVMTKFLDAIYWEQVASAITINICITERELDPNTFRRAISVMTKPVASKDFTETAVPFHYGYTAEHLGQDMQIQNGQLVCTHAVHLPVESAVVQAPWESVFYHWWCPVQPLIIKADLTGLDNDFDSFPDFPYVYLIPGISGGLNGLRDGFTPGHWGFRHRHQPVGLELVITAEVYFGLANRGGITGVEAKIEEYWASGAGMFSDTYRIGWPSYPTGLWPCDPTLPRSLPSIDEGNYSTEPDSFDFEPEGLITPSSPP